MAKCPECDGKGYKVSYPCGLEVGCWGSTCPDYGACSITETCGCCDGRGEVAEEEKKE